MANNLPPMTIYANLMEEAKARLEAIKAALAGQLLIHEMICEEFAYLQLRLLCEIVALGCLVAHGDFTQDDLTRLRNEYDADKIIRNLEALNPTFFPIPVRMTVRPQSPGDPGEVRLDDVQPGAFLTKIELLDLYGRSGNYLHRGKLKRLEARPPYTSVDFPRVAQWGNKFIRLLDQHVIGSPDNLQRWICALNDPNGNVIVAFAPSFPLANP
jgi:hypothetical protein